MKKFKQMILLVSLVICTHMGVAQNKQTTNGNDAPKWVSEKGFWVIESNVNTPKESTVRFYTNERTMIYSEKVEGMTLNIKKRRTLMKLKKALDKVVYEWEKNGIVKEQGEYLAVSGNKK